LIFGYEYLGFDQWPWTCEFRSMGMSVRKTNWTKPTMP